MVFERENREARVVHRVTVCERERNWKRRRSTSRYLYRTYFCNGKVEGEVEFARRAGAHNNTLVGQSLVLHSSTFLLFLAMDELTRQLDFQMKNKIELYRLLSWFMIQSLSQALGLLPA